MLRWVWYSIMYTWTGKLRTFSSNCISVNGCDDSAFGVLSNAKNKNAVKVGFTHFNDTPFILCTVIRAEAYYFIPCQMLHLNNRPLCKHLTATQITFCITPSKIHLSISQWWLENICQNNFCDRSIEIDEHANWVIFVWIFMLLLMKHACTWVHWWNTHIL